jgi:hypothetical protein
VGQKQQSDAFGCAVQFYFARASDKQRQVGSILSAYPARSTIAVNIEAEAAMPFVKGQSGNPGGRAKAVLPDGRSLMDLAREHTPKAVQALVEVMDRADASDAAKVSAATAILDRGWGRPKQDLGIEVKSDDAVASLLERARRLAASGEVLPPLENGGSNPLHGATELIYTTDIAREV